MDRNQVIGVVLLLALMAGYFWMVETPVPEEIATTEKSITPDRNEEKEDPLSKYQDLPDSVRAEIAKSNFGSFADLAKNNTDEKIRIENEVLELVFSTKGGIIEKATLKNFKTYKGAPLTLIDQQNSDLNLTFTSQGKTINISDLNFTSDVRSQRVNKGDSIELVFTASLSDGSGIIQTYQINGDSYEIGYQVVGKGISNIVDNKNLDFEWKLDLYQLEKDIKEERTRSNLIYSQNNSTSELSQRSNAYEEDIIEGPVDWVSFHHKYFTTSVIPGRSTGNGKVTTEADENSGEIVKSASANFQLSSGDFLGEGINMKYFFGPNDYKILDEITPNYGENVYFGWGPLKLINKYLTFTIFKFLESFIGNYGIIILIMVIIIRLALSPLTYKSHMSMAKMRVLKPELDALKEKHGGDMQKAQAEQMQLYQKAGINPISGCIPMLLQMPFLFSMFFFFPNAIELRQESFLWAMDLSVYDSIYNLPFDIPFYGNHVSLFTLLMTASTILYTWSNSQVTTVAGPMKTVQYLMPIMFLFVLNSYSAGLTFYYFVSNIFSFSQITLFKKLVNEDKIKEIMDENRKKNANKKKSKFASRLEGAMKAGDQARREKKKNK